MTDKHTPDIESSDKLPRWIVILGCLLAIIGLVAGLLGIFSPTKFFNDFHSFDKWSEISYVTTGWGIRYLAMGTVMLIALWLKIPSVIGVVFSMRFLTELGDLLNTLLTAHGSQDMPLVMIAAVWIIVFLIPEALAARWGIVRALALKR